MNRGEFSRRSFLLLGGSAALLVACAPSPPSRPTSTPSFSSERPSVRKLLATSGFHVGHRGSGDNWPEHTLTAYTNALAAGADAVEISVCATSDGVLVCHHDLSGLRVLGLDRNIADLTWAELQSASVDARTWLGESTPLEPVARLDDVLTALGTAALVFIEDKQGTNTKALLDMLDAQERATERFVWKQWAPAAQVQAAKDRGYAAWGYFADAEMDRLDEFAATFDLLGVPVGSDDDMIRRVVATGVPVMCWEVHFHDDVTRLTGLGVAGMMCANIAYLRAERPATADDFASGRRAAGDLPTSFDRLGWSAQPAFASARGALRMQRRGDMSYLMGSLADPAAHLASLTFTVQWPDVVPAAGAVGASFALTGDAPGGDGDRGAASGYELELSSDGALRLRGRDEGVSESNVLAEAIIDPPTPGAPLAFAVTLESEQISVSLADGSPILTVADARWRGPWVRLVKSYADAQAVEFSAVSATLG